MSAPRAFAPPLATLLGYDPALVAHLSPKAGRDLANLGLAWCWAALVLALPFGYTLFLLEHNVLLTLIGASAAFALTLQLLRLAVAGGGLEIIRSTREARSYRGAFTPLLWVAALGLLFGQLAQLPLCADELSRVVAAERARLIAAHTDSLTQLDAPPERIAAATSDAYALRVRDCAFVALQLRSLWHAPWQAARLTVLYLLVLLGPALVARVAGRAGLGAYEVARRKLTRSLVREDARRVHRAVLRALARYPTFSPQAAPHPFRSHARGPLAMPWPVAAREQHSEPVAGSEESMARRSLRRLGR